MERWLSWSKAHDWKSCVPYKGTEGSNPSLSAKKQYPNGYCFVRICKKPSPHGAGSRQRAIPKRDNLLYNILMCRIWVLQTGKNQAGGRRANKKAAGKKEKDKMMLSNYGLSIVLVGLGLLMVGITASGSSAPGIKRVLYLLGWAAAIVGVCVAMCRFFESAILLMFLIGMPVLIFALGFGLMGLRDYLRFSHPSQGVYLEMGNIKLNRRGERRAHPIFRYTIHDKTYQKESNDDYPVEWIEQNLQPEQSYPVWVDYNGPKGDVRLNRRFGMGPAVLMLLFSAGIAVAIFLAMQNLFQSAM